MADLNRDDTPPKSGPKWWIERLKAGEEGLYTIFSRSFYGVWTHWSMYGSTPCLGEKHQCYGCKNKLPRRWKGYIHCWVWHSKRQCFCELTPRMAESITEQLGAGQVLRGYRIKLKRGRGQKARVKVEVQQPMVGGPELVEEKSPQETLLMLWDLNSQIEDRIKTMID